LTESKSVHNAFNYSVVRLRTKARRAQIGSKRVRQTLENKLVETKLDLWGEPLKESPMARDDHNKAAEHHENAAKSHRMAAEHHGKGDLRRARSTLTLQNSIPRPLISTAIRRTQKVSSRNEC